MSKFKILIYIILTLAVAISLSVSLLYLAIQNPTYQKHILNYVTNEYEKRTETKLEIEGIEWGFPNSIILNGLCAYDQKGDTLIFAHRCKATLDVMPLFRKTVYLRTVQFSDLEANIYQTEDGKSFNFTYIPEKLGLTQDTTNSEWKVELESLSLNGGSVKFKLNDSEETIKNHFNPRDIYLTDLNGVVFIRKSNDGETSIRFRKLNFEERSGLKMNELNAILNINDKEIVLDKIEYKMDNSSISIPYVKIDKINPTIPFDKFDNLQFDLFTDESHIMAKDLAPFYEPLRGSESQLYFSGHIWGNKNILNCENLSVGMGGEMIVECDATVIGWSDLDSLNFDSKISRASLTADDARRVGALVIGREVYLPAVCDSLGIVNYSGDINGKFKEIFVDGYISTKGGNVYTDATVRAKDNEYSRFTIIGQTSAHDFDLGQVFGKETGLKTASFDLDMQIDKTSDKSFSLEVMGKIDSLGFKDYTYKGCNINGRFDGVGFQGNMILDDDNVHFEFDGKADLRSARPKLDFTARILDAHLDKLGFASPEEPVTLSFDVRAACEGRSLDDIDGFLSVDNFVFQRNEDEFYLNILTLNTTTKSETDKTISIISDYVNGNITGQYSFASLERSVKKIFYDYLPTMGKVIEGKNFSLDSFKDSDYETSKNNKFTFDFSIESTEPINEVIDLPVVFQDRSKISGSINDSTGKIQIRAESPLIMYNDITVEDALFMIENPNDKLKLISRCKYSKPEKRRFPYFISVGFNAAEDNIDSRFTFSNSEETTYSLSLDLGTKLIDYEEGGLSADFELRPTNLILEDSTWTLRRTIASLRPKSFAIDSFELRGGDQRLYIDGQISDETKDSMKVWFSDFKIGRFSDMLALKGATFDGVADGEAFITGMFSKPKVDGGLRLYDSYFNGYPFGDIDAAAAWDAINNTLVFGLDLVGAYETHKTTNIDGAVFFDKDSLFIDGHLRDVDMKFLRLYLDGVLSNNTGVLNTHVFAYGKFDDIGLEGIGDVRDFGFTIDHTGVRYNLTDTVIMTHHSFQMNNITITDEDNNKAKLNALILHKNFADFKYAIDINTDNLIAINTTEADNETYYGKAYISGNVNVSGTGDDLNLNVNARTNAGTSMTIPVDVSKGVDDASFITYIGKTEKTQEEKKRQRREKKKQIQEEKQEKNTNVNLNVHLDVTDDATVSMIVDKKLGDVIRAKGNGTFTMNYNTADDKFKLFGNYRITKGDYMFSIQSIIARKFQLMEGSTVRWNGNPTEAILDVKAKYSVNAYIGDILADDNVTTTTVNCLMGVSGTLARPALKFDIDLPNIDDDMKRKVKSVINTDESMNRNVASLLAFGSFNTSDVSSTGHNNFGALGFAALSSEISGLLSKINKDVSVGFNYRPYSPTSENGTSTEFEVALSTGLLNDRLLLNGSFGYKEGVSSLDATDYNSGIMNVDIEYKLSKNGRFRSKAFNRASNSYLRQYNSQTQGVGLMYKQDYDHISEIGNTFATPFRKLAARIKEKREKRKSEVYNRNKKEEEEETSEKEEESLLDN